MYSFKIQGRASEGLLLGTWADIDSQGLGHSLSCSQDFRLWQILFIFQGIQVTLVKQPDEQAAQLGASLL